MYSTLTQKSGAKSFKEKKTEKLIQRNCKGRLYITLSDVDSYHNRITLELNLLNVFLFLTCLLFFDSFIFIISLTYILLGLILISIQLNECPLLYVLLILIF